MKEVKVTKLNSNKPEEWLEFVNIGLKVFGKQFYTFIAMCDGDYKKLKDVEIKGNKLIDDVLFLEVDGKRVGAAMLAKQHSLMEEVEPRKKTLFLHYLMVLDGCRGCGYGTTLLQGVLDYAKQNGYEYVELINTIDLSKFSVDGNIYFQNDFTAVNFYAPKNRVSNNSYNIFFRIDVNSNVRNFSRALFRSFENLKLAEPGALTELVLKQELEKQIVDVLSVTKTLTKQELEKIRNSELFSDLTITLKSLLLKKTDPEPEMSVRNAIKVKAILKQLSPTLKPTTTLNQDLPKVYHLKAIERILCGFTDERLNKETKREILIEQDCLKR